MAGSTVPETSEWKHLKMDGWLEDEFGFPFLGFEPIFRKELLMNCYSFKECIPNKTSIHILFMDKTNQSADLVHSLQLIQTIFVAYL